MLRLLRTLQLEERVELLVGLAVARKHPKQLRVETVRADLEGLRAVAGKALHALPALVHEGLVIAPLVLRTRVHHAVHRLDD